MKKIRLFFALTLCMSASFSLFAQLGGKSKMGDEYIPNAIYEVRYWTNLAVMGDTNSYIDTVRFNGRDRASSEYTSSDCVSYHCQSSDSLVYVMLPQLGTTAQKRFELGDFVVEDLFRVTVPFRGHTRSVFKVVVYSKENDKSALSQGQYAYISKEFGILFRFNAQGEIMMLDHIDVLRNGELQDEINMHPLHNALGATDIFSGIYD